MRLPWPGNGRPRRFRRRSRNRRDGQSILRSIREAQDAGKTVVRVVRITNDAQHTGLAKKIIASMLVKRTIYRVEMYRPGDEIMTDDIEFFAVVNGQLGYVGQLVSVW